MATKKSLVEVTHDDGYGDLLLMHINSAFGGKDMRADKIVDSVAPAIQIEGIPDGWELVRFAHAVDGESYMKGDGKFTVHVGARPTQVKRLIIRKIEKPKRYRPFANAAEFEPHRDRWIKPKNHTGNHRIKTCSYNDSKHYTGDLGDTWQAMFDDCEFEDGTPFGVEVVD